MTANFFTTFPRALSADFCRNVVQRFENDPRKISGRVGEGLLRPEYKGTTEIDFADVRQGWEDVIIACERNLKFYLGQYLNPWGDAFRAVDVHHEAFRLSRYNPGQQFGWHSDNMGGSHTRVITAIWYLNSVEEGGATEFRWMDRRIAPVEGTLLFFPVGWPFFYREAPPVSGPKYTLMTQLHQVRPQVVAAKK